MNNKTLKTEYYGEIVINGKSMFSMNSYLYRPEYVALINKIIEVGNEIYNNTDKKANYIKIK